MIEELKKGFDSYFIQQPLYVKLILILTISIFLPFYITIPVIFTVGIFFISDKDRLTAILNVPYVTLYVFLSLLLLVVPLIYKNYCGFACGILLIIFFILESYLSNVMTDKLFDWICNLCCVMSFFCAMIAIAERVLNLQDRVTALTNNANYYGYMIELMVLICFYKFIATKKPVFFIIIAADIAALIFTQCRSAWTALLVGLFILSWILKKKKTIMILVIITVALAVAIYFDPSLVPRDSILDLSLTNRIYIWSQAFKDFLRNPLFGRGLLAYYQISGSTAHAHNVLIDSLESTGIVGTAVFCVLVGSVIKELVNSWKSGNEQIRARVALCGGVIGATLIHGITDTPIMGFQTGLFFFLILSLRPKITYRSVSEPVLKRTAHLDKI